VSGKRLNNKQIFLNFPLFHVSFDKIITHNQINSDAINDGKHNCLEIDQGASKILQKWRNEDKAVAKVLGSVGDPSIFTVERALELWFDALHGVWNVQANEDVLRHSRVAGIEGLVEGQLRTKDF
jgi:hypothetical protein